jgi:hypothetical protein
LTWTERQRVEFCFAYLNHYTLGEMNLTLGINYGSVLDSGLEPVRVTLLVSIKRLSSSEDLIAPL